MSAPNARLMSTRNGTTDLMRGGAGDLWQATDAQNFTSKAGKDLTKRMINLADSSQRSIELTVFGPPEQTISQGQVVAIKAVKVGSWNGKSLTLWGDTAIMLSPDMPEAHQLLGWWQQQPPGTRPPSLSSGGGGGGSGKNARDGVFSDIDDLALGLNSEPVRRRSPPHCRYLAT